MLFSCSLDASNKCSQLPAQLPLWDMPHPQRRLNASCRAYHAVKRKAAIGSADVIVADVGAKLFIIAPRVRLVGRACQFVDKVNLSLKVLYGNLHFTSPLCVADMGVAPVSIYGVDHRAIVAMRFGPRHGALDCIKLLARSMTRGRAPYCRKIYSGIKNVFFVLSMCLHFSLLFLSSLLISFLYSVKRFQ